MPVSELKVKTRNWDVHGNLVLDEVPAPIARPCATGPKKELPSGAAPFDWLFAYRLCLMTYA